MAKVGLATLGHAPTELLQMISNREHSPWRSLYNKYKNLGKIVAELSSFSQTFCRLGINKITSKENASPVIIWFLIEMGTNGESESLNQIPRKLIHITQRLTNIKL
jgi:hypothetical protein